MELLLLSISCFCNSVAIIFLAVSHIRGNRRGRGPSLSDLKNADSIQRYFDKVSNSPNPFVCFKTESHD